MDKKEEALPEDKNKGYFPEKYVWKKSYTLVLVANAIYIIFFYLLMRTFA